MKYIFLLAAFAANLNLTQIQTTWWQVESIDTVKYSRDLSKIGLNDTNFDKIINKQIENISKTGATHVAIGTPYDEEFIPIMKKWIKSARTNNLKIWFRGNWSGWEGWFEYPPITKYEHIKKTENFILNHSELFEDGDIFTACPECENGVIKDPRVTGQIEEFRNFMIEEYVTTSNAFKKINKKVISNYNSMNGDVAKLVMDKKTTNIMNGVVTIDHYVNNAETLKNDIEYILKNSGGSVILGEFGAPIPDINGNLDENQQAEWIKNTLNSISGIRGIIGINYWTSYGASTKLWNDDNNPRPSVNVLSSFYSPKIFYGNVKNEINQPIQGAFISISKNYTFSDNQGNFFIPYINDNDEINIIAEDYFPQTKTLPDLYGNKTFILKKQKENFLYKFEKFLNSIFKFFNINQ